MALEHLLSQKKPVILEKWLQLILDTYPADSSRFLKQEKDRFTNPVGYTISQELGALYEALLQGVKPDKLTTALDNIIRIRAVQDFSPSQAVAFIFLLKGAVREELASEIRENRLFEDWLQFENRVDELALLTFDIYMECREKVYEIKVNKVEAETEMASKLLARANLMSGEPSTGQLLKEGEHSDNTTLG